jgi:hypothetical protein
MQKSIAALKKKLTKIQNSEDRGSGAEMKAVQKELQHLLDSEDMQWRQRAKSDWLRDGDRNTRYFHECANARRKTNRIHNILDAEERMCDTEEEVQMGFINYFSSLFTTVDAGDMGPCLQHMEMRVSDDMNQELLKPFSEDDIRTALFQMAPLKARGPDGFPAGFYQTNWNTVGSELCRAILGTLETSILPPYMNMTNIALIPKIKKPTRVTEFRPISLCNVTYKIISKVLANRLKKILPHVISPVQSAFIPGRLITDNVLMAYETLHTMHSRITGKKGYMAIKLDMSKAYDRVEWRFLEAVMSRLGFAHRWIQLIMMCVTIVEYAIVVNGNPSGRIVPQRGLRQGDPIFPYLFLLCAESLSTMIDKANEIGTLTGVPTSKRGPWISHLFLQMIAFFLAELVFHNGII